MHAKDYALDSVLKQFQQWVIPVYQRHYSWETKEDKQLPKLWLDIEARANERLAGEDISPHFVGAIIYSEPTNQPFGTVPKRFLVDGQQRISTFSLVLCALREIAEEFEIGQMANAIKVYLFNEVSDAMLEPERERFKLWSSSHDRPIFVTLADGGLEGLKQSFSNSFYKNGKLKTGSAPKMISAYAYIVSQIRNFIEEKAADNIPPAGVLDALVTGFLTGFQIVVVQLGKEDDPQSIFASLNGQSEPLSAFDLIRNDIFHRASKQLENEDNLYEGSWRRLETAYWKEEVKQGRFKRPRTDHLVAHALVAELADDINVGQIANEYIKFAKNGEFETVEDEISHFLKYADVYEAIDRKTPDLPESSISDFLSLWDLSAFHPLVMWIGRQKIAPEEKRRAYALIESYLVRRDLLGLTRKNYNKVVPSILRHLRQSEGCLNRLAEALGELKGENSRLPSDAEVISAARNRPVYDDLGSRRLRHILRKIELNSRTKYDEDLSLNIDNLQVEHVLPNKWSVHWPLPNGVSPASEDYILASMQDREPYSEETRKLMEDRERAKNCLGNLTIITGANNQGLGNRAWYDDVNEKGDAILGKRTMLAKSLLVINRQITDPSEWSAFGFKSDSGEPWSEGLIYGRGEYLGRKIVDLWPIGEG